MEIKEFLDDMDITLESLDRSEEVVKEIIAIGALVVIGTSGLIKLIEKNKAKKLSKPTYDRIVNIKDDIYNEVAIRHKLITDFSNNAKKNSIGKYIKQGKYQKSASALNKIEKLSVTQKNFYNYLLSETESLGQYFKSNDTEFLSEVMGYFKYKIGWVDSIEIILDKYKKELSSEEIEELKKYKSKTEFGDDSYFIYDHASKNTAAQLDKTKDYITLELIKIIKKISNTKDIKEDYDRSAFIKFNITDSKSNNESQLYNSWIDSGQGYCDTIELLFYG